METATERHVVGDPMSVEDRPNLAISVVIDETLAENRACGPDLDPDVLAVVEVLFEKGRATLRPG